MATAAQRAWAAAGRANAASAPASTRILSDVDRARGTTQADLVAASQPKTVPMVRSGEGVTREEAIRQAAAYRYGSSSPQAHATITPLGAPAVVPGMIGGKDVVMKAHIGLPGMPSTPSSIHATQPTILIHGKTPVDYGKDTFVYRDPTVINVKKRFSDIDNRVAKTIPSLYTIQQKGAEFKQQHPKTAKGIYESLQIGAKGVKAPIQFMKNIEAPPKVNSIHSKAPITTAPIELRSLLQTQYQRDFGAQVALSYGETGKALGEYSVERYGMFEQAPLKTVGTEIVIPYAVGYGVGVGFKTSTFASRYGLKHAAEYSTKRGIGSAAKGFSFVGRALEPTVAAVTTAQIGSEVIKAETPKQRIEMLADIGIGFAGAAAGWRGAGKAIEVYRTLGRTEVPLESIVEPSVVSGAESFPMTRKGETPTQLIARFKESEFRLPTEKDGTFVWHAAPETLGSTAKVWSSHTRPSDVPGLYTAPSLSPHFLRVTKAPKVNLYSRLFGTAEPLEPTALRIGVSDVVRLPESVRYDKIKSREFLKTKSIKGEATLTPDVEVTLRGRGKSEAEAVITPETMLGKVEQKYYFKIDGHRVPIDTYKTVGTSNKVGKIEILKPEKVKNVKAFELAKTESYKRYNEGMFKPSYYASVGRSDITKPPRSIISSVYDRVSPTPSRTVTPRSPPVIGSIYESTPPSRPREPRSSIKTIDSYVVPPSEPYRPVPEIPRYPIPESPRYTPPPHIPPIIKLPKKNPKQDKKLKTKKDKGFQYYIENPISSPFGTSIGKVKK